MGVSLLERLIDEEIYKKDQEKFGTSHGYNPLYITKLVESYRFHENLLYIPN